MLRSAAKPILLFFVTVSSLSLVRCGVKMPPRPEKVEAGPHASLVRLRTGVDGAKEEAENPIVPNSVESPDKAEDQDDQR